MAQLSTRGSYAWIVVAHVLGAALLGGLEAWKLGNARLALAMVPVFAATGLLVGCTCALAERLAGHRRWWVAALAIAAPSLLVTMPVSAKLFDGAYAQTLPLVAALPYLVPVAVWIAIAVAVAIGRKVAAGDLTSRAILILAASGAVGVVVWAKRLLGSGYQGAQIGATIAVLVLAGVIVRLARRTQLSAYTGAALSSIVVGTTIAALTAGLAVEQDRRLLVTRGDQGRDLVRLWRGVLDLDGDGSSALLGGGDCDDGDDRVHPGALDTPGDGIDQDCDGEDAPVPPPPPPPPPQADQTAFRASLDTSVLLERTKGMNVVVITVDALRYDPLAPDATDRDDFPRLVKLLDESVYFTRAVAPASGTDVSLGTLLTGRFDPFQRVELTLPEAVRSLGRYTSSAVPGEVLRHVGEVMLGRGFDRVRKVYTDWEREDVGDHISSDDITREAIKAIRAANGKPFFVWAHYFDVHEHHQIDPPGELARAVHDGGSPAAHRYRAMLLAVDRGIGGLLDELDKRGLRDSTIIVFASDHGESLKEDPRLLDTHGIVAYAPLVRVPIALRVPGVTAGRRQDPVSLVDLAPTLLDLLCAPQTMGKLDGTSLVPALLDGPAALRPPKDRPLVSHEEQQWSVVVWPYQVLVKPADDLVELYDLEHDPMNRDDLAAKHPEITRRLRARYAEVPQVRVDRTLDGRVWREQQALPPQRRARP
ncbi:MAG: sulfatase-like hydrolase/transferase [Kofleriaceae bacterium]